MSSHSLSLHEYIPAFFLSLYFKIFRVFFFFVRGNIFFILYSFIIFFFKGHYPTAKVCLFDAVMNCKVQNKFIFIKFSYFPFCPFSAFLLFMFPKHFYGFVCFSFLSLLVCIQTDIGFIRKARKT